MIKLMDKVRLYFSSQTHLSDHQCRSSPIENDVITFSSIGKWTPFTSLSTTTLNTPSLNCAGSGITSDELNSIQF